MKHCVSYAYFRSPQSVYESLKGNSALQFEQFLPLIVRAHHVIWCGVDLVIHHDEAITSLPYWPALQRFSGAGLLRLIPCGRAERLCEAMLWRMKPVWSGEYDAVVCRDIDYIPGPYERAIFGEWLESGKAVSIIHWAPAHAGVMGGTLSVRSGRFRELVGYPSWEAMISDSHVSLKEHGDDQHLLNRLLPRFAREVLVHDFRQKETDLGQGVEVRRTIRGYSGDDVLLSSTDRSAADQLTKGCGVCWDPAEALAYYDPLDFPVLREIKRIERG